MRSTHRQCAFLSGLLDLYKQADGPIAYGQVAEKMRVTNVSAYEMLRALERRGLVASEYGEAPSGTLGCGAGADSAGDRAGWRAAPGVFAIPRCPV